MSGGQLTCRVRKTGGPKIVCLSRSVSNVSKMFEEHYHSPIMNGGDFKSQLYYEVLQYFLPQPLVTTG
jgi:hypothetical protein